MTKSSGRHIQSFLLTAFVKPRSTRFRKAGVTTGAIYTRYKNKDALFVALLQDFLKR